ncbi:MAG: EthD domain-containing protein [bacterium]|nr:EthD domain-containing protein [bacterium]
MIKLAFVLRRRADMSLEQFQTYWRETHAPLVAKHAEALGIKRYVQLHTRDTGVSQALRASRGGPEPFDGIAEIWFESETSIGEAASRPGGAEAARALLEDERRFLDLSQSPLWLAEEYEVVPLSDGD